MVLYRYKKPHIVVLQENFAPNADWSSKFDWSSIIMGNICHLMSTYSVTHYKLFKSNYRPNTVLDNLFCTRILTFSFLR